MAHIFTPALRRPLSKPFAKSGTRTLIQRAIASLRARGTDAHLWLPGVGTVNGLTTGNYLESTGNTLATVNNPCGLVLDALGTVGSELVTNGGFDSDTGWSKPAGVVISGGVLSASASTSYCYRLDGVFTAGKTYKVTYEVKTYTSGTVKAYINSSIVLGAGFSSAGVHQDYLVATNSTGELGLFFSSAFTGTIDNISVREVSGIHLTQGTTANKPVLQRGLWNLLTYSSDFTNAAWVKDAGGVASAPTITASNVSDPFGGNSATRMVFRLNGGTTSTDLSQLGTASATYTTQPYTIAVWLKTSDSSIKNFTFVRPDAILQTISVTGDWQLFVVASTGLALSYQIVRLRLRKTEGTADTAEIDICRAALFQGTLTAAQILAAGGIPTTTTAAGSNPDSGRYAWKFDGSNDKLDMGSLPFGLADDHAFIVGAQSGQVGTSIALCGLYSSVANNPRLQMYIGSANNLSMQYRSDGGTAVAPALSPALANFTPFVGSMRKIGASATLRQNGSLSSTVSVATVDVVTADRAVIGETKGSYMNGPIGPVLAIKGTVTDAELLMYERLVASLTPGAPTF